MKVNFIPNDKCDLAACDMLTQTADQDLFPYLSALLQCLQDINWPVAAPVAKRLSTVGAELIQPILDILSGDDDVWKYWIVSHLLHIVKNEVYRGVMFKLNSMRRHPTTGEIGEEVFDVVCELLQSRKYV